MIPSCKILKQREVSNEEEKILGDIHFPVVLAGFLATLGLAAYSAHQNDVDVNHFLAVYPAAKATKLDDCALCHKSGKIGSKTYGSCDYCHQIYKTQEPHGNILATLNSYGQAYKDAGRNQDALKAIESLELRWRHLH